MAHGHCGQGLPDLNHSSATKCETKQRSGIRLLTGLFLRALPNLVVKIIAQSNNGI